MLAIGGAVMSREDIGRDRYVSLYPIHPFGAAQGDLPKARPEDLAETAHLRFDPISACNARCVFCHSDFSHAVKHLTLDDLGAVAAVPMPKLHTIAVGCAYEPLMGKFFETYPSVLQSFRGQAKARIITNGALLHRRDIGPWVEFGLEYLHVSLHSHIPEVYERTMANGMRFDRIVRNLAEIRARFPGVRVLFVNVICKLNDEDVGGYCRWAFEEIGADQIVLFRAVLADAIQSRAPAFAFARQYLAEQGRGGALTDEEWGAVVRDCAPFLQGAVASELPELGASISTLTMDRPTP